MGIQRSVVVMVGLNGNVLAEKLAEKIADAKGMVEEDFNLYEYIDTCGHDFEAIPPWYDCGLEDNIIGYIIDDEGSVYYTQKELESFSVDIEDKKKKFYDATGLQPEVFITMFVC